MAETLINPIEKSAYRYERKFIAPTDDYFVIRNQVLSLPGHFKRLYPSRRINNIYFDTDELHDYMSTINGEKDRHKVRLRWYGETDAANTAQLEIKIKSDQANTKRLAHVPGNNSTPISQWLQLVKQAPDVPIDMRSALSVRHPTLINSYYRHYFGSSDRLFRLTVDERVSYQAISQNGHPRGKPIVDESRSIIEVKYDIADHLGLNRITEHLHLRMSRNSKYCNGINTLRECGYL